MKHIIVGTAGHIDHGKSALVMALTGTDPDRLKEEQARGITIDLGFAHWESADLTVAFVDVPGHERFVKNMLAGVGGIDAVLFVVAADESIMPQTREHFEICRLLRVPAGVIALTKADLVDQDVLELVTLEVRELVRGSMLEHAPVIPVSVRSGAGLDAIRSALTDLGQARPERETNGPIRLPIDRVFSVKGFGTVVTGTLVSGAISTDSDLVVLPGGRAVKVRGIHVHGSRQATAEAGQRVAVNLGGADVADLTRGDTLVSDGHFVASRVCDARLDVLPSAQNLRHGARVRFHQGTSEVIGRVALSSLVSEPGQEDPPVISEILAGRSAYVRLRLETPVVLTRGDRFILRAYSPSVTIAGGTVLDPTPPKLGIRTVAGRDRFKLLDPLSFQPNDQPPGDRALSVLLSEAGLSGVPLAAIVSRLGLPPSGVADVVSRMESAGIALRIDEALVSKAAIGLRSEALLKGVTDFHRSHPLEEGIPREEVRERLFPHAAAGVFDRAIANLVAEGRIVARDRLALTSHRVDLAGDEQAALTGLERIFRDAGLKPPDVKEASAGLSVKPGVAEKMVGLLVRQRVLVKVDDFHFHESALARLKQDVAAMKAAEGGAVVKLDVASFKQRYGISRKYAIPLLEYLDRERITRRVGDTRILI